MMQCMRQSTERSFCLAPGLESSLDSRVLGSARGRTSYDEPCRGNLAQAVPRTECEARDEHCEWQQPVRAR